MNYKSNFAERVDEKECPLDWGYKVFVLRTIVEKKARRIDNTYGYISSMRGAMASS